MPEAKGRWNGELFSGDRVSIWKDENILEIWMHEWMDRTIAKQCKCAQYHSAMHLKMAKINQFVSCTLPQLREFVI